MSDWVRIIHREGEGVGNGLFYQCANDHEWFKTFDELRKMEKGENICPHCKEQRTGEEPV